MDGCLSGSVVQVTDWCMLDFRVFPISEVHYIFSDAL